MTDSKHTYTPGPWAAFISGNTICVLGADGNHHQPVVCWMGFDDARGSLAENKANAHLMAASPEMFEACAEFVRKVEAGEARSTHSYKQMKAALSKAIGEER